MRSSLLSQPRNLALALSISLTCAGCASSGAVVSSLPPAPGYASSTPAPKFAEGQDARSVAAGNLVWGMTQAERLDDFAFWYECLRQTIERKVRTMQACLDKKKPAKPA